MSDRTWIPRIFTPEADASVDFWGRFAGKPNAGEFITFKRTLKPRFDSEDAFALIDYIDNMVMAMWIGADPRVIPDPWRAAGLEPLHPDLAHAIDASMMNGAEVRKLDGALDHFAARVARLTEDERAALLAAYSSVPDTESSRQWHAEVRYAMEYSRPEWFDLIDRAYQIARPFDGTPLWKIIIDVGLTVVVPPSDRSVADTTLAGWRAVISDELLVDPIGRPNE